MVSGQPPASPEVVQLEATSGCFTGEARENLNQMAPDVDLISA